MDLDSILTVATVHGHPLNANFIHSVLTKYSMATRDTWWSTFLHEEYKSKGIVDRIIKWTETYKYTQDRWKLHLQHEQTIKLLSKILVWMFTTPNRFIRDRATKALVVLLENHLDIYLDLLEEFKNIDDDYVLERLLASTYGSILRNRGDRKNITKIAEWVYVYFFKKKTISPNIMIRNYAYSIVDYARIKKLIRVEERIINPPYNAKLPRNFPSDDEIQKYLYSHTSKRFKDYYWSQNTIIYSMQPENTTLKGMLYGDFGRYKLQYFLSLWKTEKTYYQKFSNLAIQIIFDKLKYNVKLHGKFDRDLENRYYERHNYLYTNCKPERIGKKYQWIALYRILGIVADNFQLKTELLPTKTKADKTPWELFLRDIDPSFIPTTLSPFQDQPTLKKWFQNTILKFYANQTTLKIPSVQWVKEEKDILNPELIISIPNQNDNSVWIVLDGFIKFNINNKILITSSPPPSKGREIWYLIRGYFSLKKSLTKIIDWGQKQNFWGRWMPDPAQVNGPFLGEYPWSPKFEYYLQNLLEMDEEWIKDISSKHDLPAPVALTTFEYDGVPLNEYDCSFKDESILPLKLPSPTLVNELSLTYCFHSNQWKQGEDPIVLFYKENKENIYINLLLIRKDYLKKFLEKTGLSIFWTLLGEKILLTKDISKSKKHSIINGIYYFDIRDAKVKGGLNFTFEDYSQITKNSA